MASRRALDARSVGSNPASATNTSGAVWCWLGARGANVYSNRVLLGGDVASEMTTLGLAEELGWGIPTR